MNFLTSLKRQYHAGLAMLQECVRLCPDNLWEAGAFPRTFWRISFHTAYFAQVGLGQTETDFAPWDGHQSDCAEMLSDHRYWEPYELPSDIVPYTRDMVLEYIEYVDSLVDPSLDVQDLTAESSGFSNYSGICKLDHQLMSLRHLQHHVGQLCELLLAQNIEVYWVAAADTAKDSAVRQA